ncbi:MAG: hypothetical protein V2A71_02005 [Candidatus Eisenbacteria bacterium]
MPTVDLKPNGDLTPLQWTSTNTTHYTEIDEDVDTPSTAEKLSETTNAEVDAVALEDSPADYGSCNTVTLRVNGKASADVGYVATLRKADETVLATVTFVKNVDTTQSTKTSGAQAATLTKAEVDGLKIVFTASTA